jgi:hypothetical protein
MTRSTAKKSSKSVVARAARTAPHKWPARQLEQVDDWVAREAPDATRTEWLALSKKERLRRVELGLQSIYRDLDNKGAALQRKWGQATRDEFLISWKLAEGRQSFLLEEIDDKLAQAKEITTANAGESNATEERAEVAARILGALEDLLALRDLTETALVASNPSLAADVRSALASAPGANIEAQKERLRDELDLLESQLSPIKSA